MAAATHGTIRKRVAIMFLLVAIIIVGLVGRLIYIQVFSSVWLTENAVDQRIRDIPVEAKRGIIYDRNGKELAISVSADSVYAIPAEIRDVDEAAAKLAAILVLDSEKLAANLRKRQSFIWIKRKIDVNEAKAIKSLTLPGVGVTQESRRFYPNDNLGAHILGFTGIDSQGLDGVELTFDSYLRGKQGSIVIEYDARGKEIPYATHRFVPPVNGANVYLTIDAFIQQIVERELDKVIKETQAKAATIIVTKPRTGEVLALANRPDYNPNRFADYSPKFWRNNAVSNAYEPGSTFKIVTTVAALGEKAVTADTRFFDPGFIEVQGRTIHCWRHGGHGSQSFMEVVENSCNVGFVTVGLKLGRDGFYKYLDLFGFGKLSNIDLPGEAKGIVIDKLQVKPINLATMSMGQSIAVTPIQLITAVGAVANDGQLNRLQLIREIKDKDGNKLRSFQPDAVKQVVDAATAKEVKGILEKVVEEGTGKNARIEGYNVAGKTGTAQKVEAGGYAQGKYIASFAGFAPVDDPQVAVLVIIDEPVGIYYGGQIAAPVFAAVTKDILQYLKVSSRQLTDENASSANQHLSVPNTINLTVPEAVKELEKAGLVAKVEENGSRILDQIPKPDSRVPQGSTVLLYTMTPRYGWGEVTVPDCQGLGPREAAKLLGDLGLSIAPAGAGKLVVKQDPLPGTKVSTGTTITVYFE